MLIFNAMLVLAGLVLLLASILAFAQSRLHVTVDPRIDQVEGMLPHANCGACGYPGCRAFAEALVAGTSKPAQCTVSTAERHAQIAGFLGVDVGVALRRVARLACAGGSNVTRRRASYQGLTNCRAAALVAGGGNACAWGCLGHGDCARSCQFGAITMNRHGLPVVEESRCTACGDCVAVCPKDLFTLQPVSEPLWVTCKNPQLADAVLRVCEVGCTGCGRCAADAPTGAISMVANLPLIEPGRALTDNPIQRCPTGAIVWISSDGKIEKGKAAVKIVRNEPLHILET